GQARHLEDHIGIEVPVVGFEDEAHAALTQFGHYLITVFRQYLPDPVERLVGHDTSGMRMTVNSKNPSDYIELPPGSLVVVALRHGSVGGTIQRYDERKKSFSPLPRGGEGLGVRGQRTPHPHPLSPEGRGEKNT